VILICFVLITLLSYTPTGVIPSLQSTYCRSESVVYAQVTKLDIQPKSEGTQMNGTEFAVQRVIKGTLPVGPLVYAIDRARYRIGSEYLLFLRAPNDSELRTYIQRPLSYEPSQATPVLVSLAMVPIPVEASRVSIDTEYLVPGEDLIRAADVLALREANKPFIVPEAKLDKALLRMGEACDQPTR
jgi:hypothetical protein